MPEALVPYEISGPTLLARTPAIAPPDRAIAGRDWQLMRNHLETRLYGLRSWRLSWWAHWAELAVNILPRRYHWLIVPNTMTRGLPINQQIVDGTGTQAMRLCAACMMEGLASRSRPWFKLKPGIQVGGRMLGWREARAQLDRDGNMYLDEVEERSYSVLAGSNYYDTLAQLFEDNVTFGTSPMIIYEDQEDVIRCYGPCAGEYYLGVGNDFRVQTFYRTFVLTVLQIVQMFGLANVGSEVQGLWAQKGATLEQELIVAHAIEPNFSASRFGDGRPDIGVVKGGYTWREYYWLWGRSSEKPLSVRGFYDNPGVYWRWATTSNDAYGRSPAMDALGDIQQLQVMTRRLAEAVEKQVRPPMLADMKLKHEPTSILPGHVTYVPGLTPDTGMRPTYTVTPEIAEMVQLIEKISLRIERWFFNDVFQAISQMEGVQPRNEMEINERRGEKIQRLGSVIDKCENELLSPSLRRITSIMGRRNMLPPKPPSVQRFPIVVEYIGPLSLLRRASMTAAMEQGIRVGAQMSQLFPDQPVLDNIDPDEAYRLYLDRIAFPQRPIRSTDVVAQIRQKRAKMMQQKEAAAHAQVTAPAAADTAKTLSDTDVGGGINALQMLLGNAPPAGAA